MQLSGRCSVRKLIFVLLLILISPSLLAAATYHVKIDGTGDFTTIQAAVNAASPGDTVLVYEGDYLSEGRITFPSSFTGAVSNLLTIKSEPRRTALVRGFRTNNKGTSSVGAGYIRFEGFLINSTETHSGLGGGILAYGHGIEIVDNYFYDCLSAAIITGGYYLDPLHVLTNITISYNHIYKSAAGMSVWGTGHVIEHNEVERPYQWGTLDADYSRMFGSGFLVRYNHFHGGIAAEVGGSHVDGIQTYRSGGGLHDSIIENNIFMDYHQGFLSRSNETAATNLIFRNNVYDNRSWDPTKRSGQGTATGGGQNISFVNNLYIGHSTAARFFQDGAVQVSGVVQNNIFIDNTSPISLENNYDVAIGNNLFFNYGWVSAHTTVASDVFADPLLEDIDNMLGIDGLPFTVDDGYRLTAESPAIGAGASLTGIVDTDMFGVARPQSTSWDIGPHEYSGTAPTCTENLSFCVTQETCEAQGGYWYNDVCNAEPSPITSPCSTDRALCETELDCVNYWGGYWWGGECQSSPDPEPLCPTNHQYCNVVEDCYTYWPAYMWSGGECVDLTPITFKIQGVQQVSSGAKIQQ